uniref:HTH myb-type domain-containing protein n=1 Tax=Solanum lycopersicum TaxID=4081 RepID=A0A3Q7JBH4_SOLLC
MKKNKVIKQKNCLKWTANLHAKFMKSLEQLGEGRCYPKEIVAVMDVPGLTRMQVASHLQKCRFNNWRSPEERKSNWRLSGQESSSESQQKSSNRKYGTMPRFQNNIPNQIQKGPEFPFSTPNTSIGESSTQEKLYPPQCQEIQTTSTMMSDVDSENVTSNKPGIITSNFQQHIAEQNVLSKQYNRDK